MGGFHNSNEGAPDFIVGARCEKPSAEWGLALLGCSRRRLAIRSFD